MDGSQLELNKTIDYEYVTNQGQHKMASYFATQFLCILTMACLV